MPLSASFHRLWRVAGLGARGAVLGAALFGAAAAGTDASPSRPADRFFRLSDEEGLAHSDVRAIAQDRAGFMWFGLRLGGLTRYDGYDLKVYEHDPDDPRTIASRVIWCLLVDRQDNLWIGTEGGLDRLDRATGTFEHFRHDPARTDSLPHNVVVALREDSAGRIWVATRDGLSRLDDAARGTFKTFRRPQVVPGSTANDTYRSITEDPATGLLWLGASDGMAAFDPRTGCFATYLHDPADPQSLSNNAVNTVVRDPNGGFWALTEHGLNFFEPRFAAVDEHAIRKGTMAFRRYFPDETNVGAGVHFMRDGLFDHEGRMWIASRGGVHLFDRTAGTFTSYRRRARDPTSLADDLTQAIFQDRSGGLWVGTYAGGVSLLRLRAKPFRVEQHDPETPGSLSDNRVAGLAFDLQGRLWVATNRGLNRRDANGWTRFLHDPADEGSLPSNDISVVAITPAGEVWVGSNYRGAARFDQRRFYSFPVSPSNVPAPDGWHDFTGSQVNSLLPGRDGGIWLGARAYGLDYHREGRFRHYSPRAPSSGDAGQPTTNAVFGFEAEDGRLWFATETSGLIRLDVATGEFTAFAPPSRTAGVSHSLHCMERGLDGHIWLGAADGLFRFDPAAGRFVRHYTVADGLPHAAVMTIVRDNRGHLWIGTANGLADFDPVAGRFRTYQKPDGLPANVFSQRAGVLGPDGRVYLGTRAGIVDFQPEELRDNPEPPPVVLTELRWIGTPPAAVAELRPESAYHLPETVQVPPGQPGFALRFSALDYTAPEKNQFQYRLEGWDESWRTASARERSAAYTALPPGAYTFRVRATNPDGVWNETGASVRIVVEPFYWQTWWFRGGLALCALVAVLAVIQWRLSAIRNANLRLERQVAERTVELQREVGIRQQAEARLRESHAELERRVEARTAELARSNASLQDEIANRRVVETQLRQAQKMEAVGRLAGGIAHDFNNLLTVILGQTTLLSFPDLTPEERADGIRDIKAAAQRASNLTRQLLIFSRQQEMKPAALDLNRVVANVAKLLARVLGERIALHTEMAAGPLGALADAGMIEQVLLNLAVNARDAMPRGGSLHVTTARVTVGPDRPARVPDARPGDFVRISVADTGSGIPDDILPRIFDPFFTTKEAGKGTGLGLAITHGIIQQHLGWIEVETAPDAGTTFHIFLPAQDAVASSSNQPFATAPAGGGNITVLLVEDEEAVRSIVCRMLEAQGHRVIESASPAEALQSWAQHREAIDLLITDIVMPGPMTGHDLVERLRRDKPGLRIVTMSGYDPTEVAGAGVPAGRYLRKPFSVEELLRAIES